MEIFVIIVLKFRLASVRQGSKSDCLKSAGQCRRGLPRLEPAFVIDLCPEKRLLNYDVADLNDADQPKPPCSKWLKGGNLISWWAVVVMERRTVANYGRSHWSGPFRRRPRSRKC